MSDFQPGYAGRIDTAAAVLTHAYTAPLGFAPVDLLARIAQSAPQAASQSGPKHFSPAAPGTNPTAGWDPLDPTPSAQFIDPIEAARTAGYEEGLAAAVDIAEAAADRDRALMAALVAQLAGGRLDREAMAQRLRQTVMLLVTKLVGEIGVSGEKLIERIDAATECLADASESALLRVNPEDLKLIDGKLPATIFAAGDPSIGRGAFVLEAASTVVEDGPTLWLDQLAAAIERVPVSLARAA